MNRRIPIPQLRRHLTTWPVVAALGGASLALTGLSPTGSRVVDLVLVAVLGALWLVAASAAPQRVLVLAVVAATAATGNYWSIGVGVAVVALMAAWRSPTEHVPMPAQRVRSVVLAIALGHLLARVRPLGTFGASTVAALVVAAAILVIGWRGHDAAVRQVLRRCTWVLGGAAVVCAAGFGITAATAGSNLIDGGRAARAALRLADSGDLDAALTSFNKASSLLRSADRSLDAWWGAPGRLMPLVAQHQQAIRQLAHDAAAASEEIAGILERTDYDALGVVEGRIDLDAVRALDAPIGELEVALDDLAARIDGVNTDWVAAPITGVIRELADDVTSKRLQLDDVRSAIEEAPAMLGAEGPRRYFIALTTPAEARGLGGFMGNWAEITVDQGRLELTGFGRHNDLTAAAPRTPRLTGMPAEYIAQYGAYVLADPATLEVGPGAWQTLTVAPHFPWVAEVIANLYPQSGGSRLNGVFVMDVYTVSTLMTLTGPVSVPGLGVEITPENALKYLLRDQYLLDDNTERIDLLETLARTTIDRLLAGSLPPPPRLAALLRPLVQQQRLAAWAERDAEQEVFRNANMTKEIEAEPGAHVMAYTLYNAAGNKIDAYLDASADYSVTTDIATGDLVGTLTLRMRNTAPASGLPDYVIGNLVELPRGTNRTIVSVLSTAAVRSMSTDRGNVSWITGAERGLSTASTTIEIEPGGEVVLTVELVGPDAADATMGPVVLHLPPAANPIPTSLRVNGKLRTQQPLTVSGRFVFEP